MYPTNFGVIMSAKVAIFRKLSVDELFAYKIIISVKKFPSDKIFNFFNSYSNFAFKC